MRSGLKVEGRGLLAWHWSGLLHISEIANERVRQVTDVLKEGEMIDVKVLEVDRAGRIKLSRKALLQ